MAELHPIDIENIDRTTILFKKILYLIGHGQVQIILEELSKLVEFKDVLVLGFELDQPFEVVIKDKHIKTPTR